MNTLSMFRMNAAMKQHNTYEKVLQYLLPNNTEAENRRVQSTMRKIVNVL